MNGRSKAAGSIRGRAALAALLAALLCLCLSPAGAAETVLGKAELANLLTGRVKQVARGDVFTINSARYGRLTVEPTIDPAMQRRAEHLLRHNRDHRAAVLVMDADSGRVLAMAGVKHRRLDARVALDHTAPSASLFKIVTATAALEESDLRPDSTLEFVGRPHTLYRFQLRERLRRHPEEVTLAESFAKSNNPVFARLGLHDLGGKLISWYARTLGFDRNIPFELPLGKSILPHPANDFELAGMACGFHRKTTISPVHAALLVSVFINGGRLLEPYVINRVTGQAGEVLYLGRPGKGRQVVGLHTCRDMRRLFEATISEGTARRAFRRAGRDRVLKDLEIGGKTGTLRGPSRKELFEWFAGYGFDPESGRALSVATLVVHGNRRYQNSKRLARHMLQEAFAINRNRIRARTAHLRAARSDGG